MSDGLDTIPHRILIIKPSSLGDVVTGLPVLRGIRRTFPEAHVTWMVAKSCAEVIKHDRDLDEIILFDRAHLGKAWWSPRAARDLFALLLRLRRGKFDWVIDLQGLLRSALFAAATRAPVRCGFADAREGATMFYTHAVKVQASHTVQRNLDLAAFLSIDGRAKDLVLEVSPEGKAFAAQFLQQHGLRGKDFLICVPPTRWPTKRYPVRHWQTVVKELSRSRPVVLMGAPGDRELCESIACADVSPSLPCAEPSRQTTTTPRRTCTPYGGAPCGNIINLAGQTSVSQMIGLIAVSGGVICSDSAAKFIAPAVGVNTVVLLGPTRAANTGPFLPGPWVQAETIIAPVPCQGCLKRRCRHITCMELIEPQRVIDAAKKLSRL